MTAKPHTKVVAAAVAAAPAGFDPTSAKSYQMVVSSPLLPTNAVIDVEQNDDGSYSVSSPQVYGYVLTVAPGQTVPGAKALVLLFTGIMLP